MNKITNSTLKNLLDTRLQELGCADLPAPVRTRLERKVATELDAATARLIIAVVTPRRVAAAFAAHLGVGRVHAITPPMPPKPGVSGV
jgi:hypothetical protein